MRRYLVAGNWKMHGSKQAVSALVEEILAGMGNAITAEIAVCPPYVFLSQVNELAVSSGILLGAQNVSAHDKGAFTGEISAQMLTDLGCTYVIVGHSERRGLYAESDTEVADKFKQASAQGLRPILCVGETLEQRELNQTQDVIARQLDAVLDSVGVEGLTDAVYRLRAGLGHWYGQNGHTGNGKRRAPVHSWATRESFP